MQCPTDQGYETPDTDTETPQRPVTISELLSLWREAREKLKEEEKRTNKAQEDSEFWQKNSDYWRKAYEEVKKRNEEVNETMDQVTEALTMLLGMYKKLKEASKIQETTPNKKRKI